MFAAIRTTRDVALSILLQTTIAVAIAVPATFAVTFAWFSGDLSRAVDGWSVLRFALLTTATESLVICPLIAVRGAMRIRTINNLRDRLHVLASCDPLTGLLNRRGLDEGVQALPKGGALAVLVGDLDHFKRFNDRYGHDFGDEVLRTTAKLLLSLAGARPTTLLARFGGEEFVVALGGARLDEARLWADMLRTRLAACHIEGPDGPVGATLSIGVATTPAFDGDIAALIKRADAGLYCAKLQGRNRVATEFDTRAEAAAA